LEAPSFSSGVVAAFFARKTKNDAAPASMVTMTAIRLKMPALRLLAWLESDWPKHAAHANALEFTPITQSAKKQAAAAREAPRIRCQNN
jgi:hypothetical protein